MFSFHGDFDWPMAIAVNAVDSKPIRSSAAVDSDLAAALVVVVVALVLAAVIWGGVVTLCC